MSEQKLTTEEFNELTRLRSEYITRTSEIGLLMIEKRYLEDELSFITSKLNELYEAFKEYDTIQAAFGKSLEDKYGNVSINPESGVIETLV